MKAKGKYKTFISTQGQIQYNEMWRRELIFKKYYAEKCESMKIMNYSITKGNIQKFVIKIVTFINLVIIQAMDTDKVTDMID